MLTTRTQPYLNPVTRGLSLLWGYAAHTTMVGQRAVYQTLTSTPQPRRLYDPQKYPNVIGDDVLAKADHIPETLIQSTNPNKRYSPWNSWY